MRAARLAVLLGGVVIVAAVILGANEVFDPFILNEASMEELR